jgi:hypothetical protein
MAVKTAIHDKVRVRQSWRVRRVSINQCVCGGLSWMATCVAMTVVDVVTLH